jgi:guanylate kinase
VKKTSGLIFVISGPSGSGKTTLASRLLRDKEFSKRMVKSISLTTRQKRTGEVDKEDYFFVSKNEFNRLRRSKKILEWTNYLGYYYGTPKDFVDEQLESGKSVLLCLDLKGALIIKKVYPECVKTIFVMPPSIEVLRERIAGRCNKTKIGEIKKRVTLAKKELLSAQEYDYSLVNNNLKEALNQLKNIVLSQIKNNLAR